MRLKMDKVACFLATFMTILTLTCANVFTFSIADVNAELQTYGTVSFERTNNTVDLEYSRLTLRVSEVSVLDSSGKVLSSHPYEMVKHEFTINKWEGDKFMDLKVSARRLVSGPMDNMFGFIDLFVYLFTQEGEVDFIKEDYGQTVKIDDALVVININEADKCQVCANAAFVDLKVEVTTKSQMEMKAIEEDIKGSALDIVHIPASAGVFFGKMASIDSERKAVEGGYPKVEVGSEKTNVTVRLPAFSSTGSYALFVRQDRRTVEQAKKDGGSLGAIMENSASYNNPNLKYLLMWFLCFACYILV